jgi:predicted ABC-type ATPase
MDRFAITPEEHARISDIIIATRTAGLTGYSTPLFFLNAGQPGSGKTFLNIRTIDSVDGDVLECNADTLRDNHPHAVEILREREDDYPRLTWDAADRWNQALIAAGVERQYNILIETTLRKAGQALETLEGMKRNGYRTFLQVLAVPSYLSWLSIHHRFESQKAMQGWARAVSETDHDDRVLRLETNLPVSLR